jgi:cell division protein FtsN
MGNIIKIFFASIIIIMLVVYTGLGYTLNKAVDEKISKLETIASDAAKKKDYLLEQSVSLGAVKKNLQNELALETDKAIQKQVVAQLTALNVQQRQEYLKQMEILQQQQLELQKQQAAAKKTTTKKSSSSSSSTTTTNQPSTPAPAPAPAPKPPKVTSAS